MDEKGRARAAQNAELRDSMDKVMARITLDDIAKAAGYSVNALKQARLDPSATGYRTPPPGLRRALYELCMAQAKHFLKLARQLKPPKG